MLKWYKLFNEKWKLRMNVWLYVTMTTLLFVLLEFWDKTDKYYE